MSGTSIVARANIADVLCLVGVVPALRGERIWFTCPSHADAHPSAVIVGERGWRCFACGARGGVLHLAVAFGLAGDRSEAARLLEKWLS